MDIVNRMAGWIEHNRYVVLAGILTVGLMLYSYGCQSSTSFDGQVVDRAGLEQLVIHSVSDLNAAQAQLDAKRQALVEMATAAEADLDQQDEQRQAIIDSLGNVVTSLATGSLNPAAAITGAVSLVGIVGGTGLALDNRRKNSVIRKLKNGGSHGVDGNSSA
jgi:outer membrane murein-binding lipoprotein Lpp